MWGPWGWLFFPLLIVVLLGVGIWLVRAGRHGPMAMRMRHGHNHGLHGPWGERAAQELDPREILRLRYARGELSREEYLRMLEDLEAPHRGPTP